MPLDYFSVLLKTEKVEHFTEVITYCGCKRWSLARKSYSILLPHPSWQLCPGGAARPLPRGRPKCRSSVVMQWCSRLIPGNEIVWGRGAVEGTGHLGDVSGPRRYSLVEGTREDHLTRWDATKIEGAGVRHRDESWKLLTTLLPRPHGGPWWPSHVLLKSPPTKETLRRLSESRAGRPMRRMTRNWISYCRNAWGLVWRCFDPTYAWALSHCLWVGMEPVGLGQEK